MAKVKKVQKKTAVKKAVAKKQVTVKKTVAKKVLKVSSKAKPAKKAAVKKAGTKPAKKKAVKKILAKKAIAKKDSPAKKTTANDLKAKPNQARKKVAIKETSGTVSQLKSKTIKSEAIMQPKNNSGQEDSRTKYSEEELKEFEVLILEKLERAKKELVYIKESLSRKNDESSDNSNSNLKLLEDGADTLEKENFSQLAARQMKFIQQLEFAVIRIKNGTYGVCIETGKLIPKERLRAVPHTQHSIEAKLNRK